MLDMDAVVREQIGQSVLSELYSPTRVKADSFERLLLTHPAIFMVEFALAQALKAKSVVPDLTLGVSMGSFAAAAVAGCITAEEALISMLRQVRCVEAHCEPGGMIAVLAQQKVLDELRLRDHCEIAAENFSSHFVVSAPQHHLDTIEERLKTHGVTFQRLAVKYAFHSRWFDGVRDTLLAATGELSLKTPKIPIVCCALASTIQVVPQGYFWTVARQPILFARTIEHLESRRSYRYIDVGPAGSLATFLKYAMNSGSASQVSSVLSPFGGELKNLARIERILHDANAQTVDPH